jgi:hypothetical protein
LEDRAHREERKGGREMKTIFPCWHNGVKSYVGGGSIQCDVCESFSGVRAKNYWRKDKSGNSYLKLFVKCVKCGSLEIRNNHTGEILKQVRKEVNDHE